MLTKPLGTQIAVNAHQWIEQVGTKSFEKFCKELRSQASSEIIPRVIIVCSLSTQRAFTSFSQVPSQCSCFLQYL